MSEQMTNSCVGLRQKGRNVQWTHRSTANQFITALMLTRKMRQTDRQTDRQTPDRCFTLSDQPNDGQTNSDSERWKHHII